MFGLSVATLVIGIILIAFILFMTELIPLAATAISVAVGFYLIGAIDANTALKSFSSPTTMIIASMAVIGEAVFKPAGQKKSVIYSPAFPKANGSWFSPRFCFPAL